MNSSPVSLLLRNRHLLAMVIVVICVAGISSLTTMPRQEDPRITNRNPIVTTLMPGASAERVEALVTEKIEDALDEIAEIKNVESTSRPGISLISIELADAVTTNTNEDIFSKIRDRLDAASRDFPPEALPPDFDDKRGAVAFGLVVALQWQASSEVQLGLLDRLAETLADRLRNVPGTELVRLYGEPEEQLTLEVDPNELTALGLSTGILARRLAEADAKGPAGFWRSADTNLALEFSGELDSTARIRSIPILENEDGSVLRLGDLADVRKEYRSPPSEIGLSNGQRTVLLAARPQDGIRLDSWGEQARQEVAAYQTEIGGGIVLETVFDQSDYTQQRLSELGANLLMGALVILAVIGVMMGWRSSLLVGAALPLTALATVFVVASSGGELHQMSIFGMIIALGLLIDNAIVVVDEATQRLRRGMETLAAVEDTLRHLFVPLLASTLTTVLAFMPIVLLPGNAGDFVRSIGTSVMVALVSSFLISLGLILALTGLFGSRQPLPAPWWKVGFSSRRLEATYRKAMLWLMHRPLLAMALAMLFPLVGFGLATTLGSQFFPRVDRNMLEVTVRLPSQASIAATAASIRELDARLRNDPVVQRTDWLVGASYPSVYYNLVMNQDNTPSFAHGIITTQDAAQVEGLIRRIQALAARDFPGLEVTATEFAQGPPQDAPIVFRLFGPDN
ncbi:MAG: efflux RND transporter permease subunit, partial [Verrucomicrobiota bacterium]